MTHEEALAAILADYRRELENHHVSVLKTLVEAYGLVAHDSQSAINVLVEHFRQQLLKGER